MAKPEVSPDPQPGNHSQRGSTAVIGVLVVLFGLALAYGLGVWSGGGALEPRLASLESEVKALKSRAPAAAPNAGSPPTVPSLKTGIDMATAGMATKGAAKAPVTLIEFSDFQCPFCARYVRDTMPTLVKEYVDSGKVRYVFRHFPIESLHPGAPKAAEAATCAQAQGKFWPMHDLLFANPRAQGPDELKGYARQVGLEMKPYEACLGGPAGGLVKEDLTAGANAGIGGTPAFFIGPSGKDGLVRVTHTVYGARPYQEFKGAIEAALKLEPR